MSKSMWKRQATLRQREQEAAAGLESEQQSAPAPAQDSPSVQDAPSAAAGHADAAAPLPAATGDYGWLTADFDPNDVPDDMPAVSAPPVSAPAAPEPMAPPTLPAVTAPIVSIPAVAPPPLAETAVASIVPPVVAVAAATAEAAPSVPFWKKELSFGGSKKQKEPKAAKAPKAAKEPKSSDATPFWKKELSLGAGKQKEPKAAKAPKAAKEPKVKDSTPFWKKELSLGRKAASTGTVASQVAAVAAAPVAEQSSSAQSASAPFWKKELSFGKGKTPKAARTTEPKQAKEPKAGKEAKAPRAKRAPKAGRAPSPGKGQVIGLKIGASQVVAARIANGAAPQLLQVARATLPDGVVVGGELRDVETLTETLRELFAQNKLPKKSVRLGIANNRIGVRTFDIAGIDDPKQLANAIRFRAQETLPIPLEEAVLDWQVLSEWRDAETNALTRRVLLVVAYRELVDRYVDACKRAGIRLSGIDLEAFAMLRALNEPAGVGVEATAAQVAVNVGHDRSTFAVAAGGTCEFTRVLSWGGQNLSVAIARVLDRTPSEADPIKHAMSLVATTTPLPEGVTPEVMETARGAVVRELQAFARELVSSLRFYQNQPGSLGIGELVLTGGTGHLPGFADELGRLIGVPVRVGDPLNRVAIPKKFREPEDCSMGSLTVAIGLGIDD